MKILVAIKRAVDYPHTINPYDLVALEQALCLREAGKASQVLVVSMGSDTSQETLRSALAMGADRAIFVRTDEAVESVLQPLAVAKIIQVLVQSVQPRLLILGRQAVGADHGQTGQMLSALLDWPQATFVSNLNFTAEGDLQVTREMDHGLQVLSLQLPAVVTVNLCLNEPRLITISNIIKAKQKPLEIICLEDLGVDVDPRLIVRQLTPVKVRRAGVKVNSVAELVYKLRHEAKVL